MRNVGYGSVTLKDSLMSKGHGVVQRRILELLESRATQCKPSSRIYFHKESGERSDKPVPGCAFYYLGADDAKFCQVFGNIGQCSRAV